MGLTTVTFPTPGQYRVDFDGNWTSFNLGNAANKNKFRTVEQWGSSNWTTMSSAFAGVAQLVFNAVDTPDLSSVTDMSYMFDGATNFNSPIGNWDVSNVTSLFFTFRNAAAFNQPLNNWDISNVADIRGIFKNAAAFNQPLNSWDVSQITQMHSVFAGATSFNQPLNSWDVSQVTSFRGEAPYTDEGMFAGATSFNQPLDAWNMVSATDMRYMFNGATAFNQPLNSWNFSNVTNTRGMFQNASAFNQPLNNWDVSNVTDFREMFFSATAFNRNLGAWQIQDGVLMTNVFRDSGLTSQNYADILAAWSALIPSATGIDLGIVSTTYCDTAESARTTLIDTHLWTITDLGPEVCAAEVVPPTSVVSTGGGSGSSGTAVGLRQKRLDDLKSAMSSSTAPVSEKLTNFVTSLKKFLSYLTTHEEEVKNLSPEESKTVIIVLRDAIIELLKWLPGV